MMDDFRSYVLHEISEIRDLVVKIKCDENTMGSMQQALNNMQQGLASGGGNNSNDGRRVMLIF